MRVFLLLLSFFFFSFFCLDFVSLLFLFFPSVFSLVCCVQLAVQQTTFSARDVRL